LLMRLCAEAVIVTKARVSSVRTSDRMMGCSIQKP